MKDISNFIKLSASERRGAYVIIGLILVVQILNRFIPQEVEVWSESNDADLFAAFVASRTSQSKQEPIELFKFNPNRLDSAGWIKLGLSPKQVASVLNYRRAIGGFYNPQSLLKAYAVDSTMLSRWNEFIEWDSPVQPKNDAPINFNVESPEREWKAVPKTLQSIELNSADSASLLIVRGIGPITAQRIIKYRNLIGGFQDLGQLKEVYGFREENRTMALEQLTLDPSLAKKICINQSDEEELSNHPYIRHSIARVIIAYRNQHGEFKRINQLLDVGVISDSLYTKIKPYVDLCEGN